MSDLGEANPELLTWGLGVNALISSTLREVVSEGR